MNEYVSKIISTIESKNKEGLERILNEIGKNEDVTNELLSAYGLSNVKTKDLKKVSEIIYTIKENNLGIKLLAQNNKLFDYSPKRIRRVIKEVYSILKEYNIKPERVVMNHPYLLSTKISTVSENLEYLNKICKEYDIDLISTVEKYGSILIGVGLKEKVEFLTRLGMDPKTLIEHKGTILSLNLENNLKPKIEYLMKEVGIGRQTILDLSSLLTASLEKRIKPRWERVKEYRELYNDRSLMYLLTHYTDKEFEKEVKQLNIIEKEVIKVINYSDEEIEERLNAIANNTLKKRIGQGYRWKY